MSRPRPRRALLFALTVLLVAVPARALAGAPEIFHGTFDDSFEDASVCGLTVDIRSQGVFTDRAYFDRDGNFVRFASTVSGRTTYTAADGDAVVVQFANLYTEGTPTIDEAAGTITFTSTYKGLPEKMQTSRGAVLLRDAGIIAFANTFDLDTGAFISSETVLVRGPHPEADSDFAAFCEVLTEALG
jgi:hypothetical protein